MDFKEYRAHARRTMNSDLDKSMQAAVAALGLVGEACEFVLAPWPSTESTKEAGDVCWYVAWLCDIYEIEDLKPYHADRERILIDASKIADMVKKQVGHGHVMPVAELQQCLEVVLWSLMSFENMAEVYETNIAKLKQRYPDGFSTERSINRDQ